MPLSPSQPFLVSVGTVQTFTRADRVDPITAPPAGGMSASARQDLRPTAREVWNKRSNTQAPA
jgi:hypothetical protein